MIYFSRIGSIIGSTSFSIDSMSTGKPSYSGHLSASLRLGWLSVKIQFCSRRIGSLYLIHVSAWPWGSIISGYRDDLVTMIPFWMERSSEGSPSRFHSPTVAASTKNWVSWRSSDTGIDLAIRSVWKYSSRSLDLNSELNGPQYETKAHALATSPTSYFLRDLNSLAFLIHLSLLSCKELMSLFA